LKNTAKILLIDIETAPKVAYVWQTFKVNISPEQIVSDTHLLSYAAKWLGDKFVIYDDQSKSKTLSDDRRLLKGIHALLDEADVVVGHNGQAFDLPFILTRMAAYDMTPPSPFRQVDTCRVARSQFGFTFNKLEFLARALDCEVKKNQHKNFPGMSLWRGCLNRVPAAWKEMRIYNIDDVLALEGVYLKLRPWITGHPNLGMYVDDGDRHCPACASVRLVVRKHYYTQTSKYKGYRCSDCGKYSRGRSMENSPDHRKTQLAN
jgi:hypothetical protein